MSHCGIIQDAKASAYLGDRCKRVEQIVCAPRQPVELGDNKQVTAGETSYRLRKLPPVCDNA